MVVRLKVLLKRVDVRPQRFSESDVFSVSVTLMVDCSTAVWVNCKAKLK